MRGVEALKQLLSNYCFHHLFWVLYSVCGELRVERPKWVEPIHVDLLLVPNDIEINIAFSCSTVVLFSSRAGKVYFFKCGPVLLSI